MLTLADRFLCIAYRSLTEDDIIGRDADECQFLADQGLTAFFGREVVITGSVWWHHFSENHDKQTIDGTYRFTQHHASDPSKNSMWLLAFKGDHLLNCSQAGDTLLLLKCKECIHALILETESAWERSVTTLFGIERTRIGSAYQTLGSDWLQVLHLDFQKQLLLDQLGL